MKTKNISFKWSFTLPPKHLPKRRSYPLPTNWFPLINKKLLFASKAYVFSLSFNLQKMNIFVADLRLWLCWVQTPGTRLWVVRQQWHWLDDNDTNRYIDTSHTIMFWHSALTQHWRPSRHFSHTAAVMISQVIPAYQRKSSIIQLNVVDLRNLRYFIVTSQSLNILNLDQYLLMYAL